MEFYDIIDDIIYQPFKFDNFEDEEFKDIIDDMRREYSSNYLLDHFFRFKFNLLENKTINIVEIKFSNTPHAKLKYDKLIIYTHKKNYVINYLSEIYGVDYQKGDEILFYIQKKYFELQDLLCLPISVKFRLRDKKIKRIILENFKEEESQIIYGTEKFIETTTITKFNYKDENYEITSIYSDCGKYIELEIKVNDTEMNSYDVLYKLENEIID